MILLFASMLPTKKQKSNNKGRGCTAADPALTNPLQAGFLLPVTFTPGRHLRLIRHPYSRLTNAFNDSNPSHSASSY